MPWWLKNSKIKEDVEALTCEYCDLNWYKFLYL